MFQTDDLCFTLSPLPYGFVVFTYDLKLGYEISNDGKLYLAEVLAAQAEAKSAFAYLQLKSMIYIMDSNITLYI